MKKIYEKPTMGIVSIKAVNLLQASAQSIKINSTNNYNGTTTIEANERGGNIINVGEGYNRSLW